MALFTDKRELDQQDRHRNFRKVTGNKKTALSLLGYKDDGTKNAWGNILGTGVGGSYLAEGIAGEDSDTSKVIDSAEGEQWASTMATAKLAMNFIPGGSASKLMGGGKEAAGGLLSKIGGGAIETPNADALKAMQGKQESLDAMTKLNNGGFSEQTIDGVTTTTANGIADSSANVGDSVLDDVGQQAFQKYLEENPEGTMEEFMKTYESESGDGVEKVSNALDPIPIIGDAAGVVSSRVNLDKQLKSEKAKIDNQTVKSTFNYL